MTNTNLKASHKIQIVIQNYSPKRNAVSCHSNANIDHIPTSYTLYRTISLVAMTFFKSLNKLLTNKASKPSWVCAILERDLMAWKQKQELIIKNKQTKSQREDPRHSDLVSMFFTNLLNQVISLKF